MLILYNNTKKERLNYVIFCLIFFNFISIIYIKDGSSSVKHQKSSKYFGSIKSSSSTENGGEKAFKRIMSGGKKLPTKFTLKEKKSSSQISEKLTSSSSAIDSQSATLMDTSFGSQHEMMAMMTGTSSTPGTASIKPDSIPIRRGTTDRSESNSSSIVKQQTTDRVVGITAGQGQRREVTLYRDENLGFGFIAGSEKPLKIRFVTPG